MSIPSTAGFAIQGVDGKARVSTWTTKNGVMATPASLLHTRRGFPMQMSQDLIRTLHKGGEELSIGVQMNVMHCLTQPTPAIMIKQGGGAHGYYNMGGHPILASNRDPSTYEYHVKPSTDASVHVMVHGGGVQVTPELYMSAVQAMRPDIYVTMCDELPVPGVSNKRRAAAAARNLKWLDCCLDLANSLDVGRDSLALAPVGGGADAGERNKAATAVADKPVAGFALCGFGTGEDPSSRAELICAAVEPLPNEKPRFMSGVSSPVEVLDAVAEGVDLFDNSYVMALTEGGYAACFQCKRPEGGVAMDFKTEGDAAKMNLLSLDYRYD
eukprot:gene17411-23711_t